MFSLTQANRIVDIPDLNRFQIGDHVIVDASAENDRFEGVIVGLEMQRVYGSNYFVPSITLLHDGYLTDGFKPMDCRKVDTAPPQSNLRVTGFRGNPLRVVLSSGDEASVSQKLIDSFASPSPFEQHPDDVAVDRFAAAMKAKLARKRAEGVGGWDDPEQCHIDYLVHLLAEQIHSRAVIDPVDIGNFAMMIFNRGETPSHGR